MRVIKDCILNCFCNVVLMCYILCLRINVCVLWRLKNCQIDCVFTLTYNQVSLYFIPKSLGKTVKLSHRLVVLHCASRMAHASKIIICVWVHVCCTFDSTALPHLWSLINTLS